jgi:lysophospholipase L1-like esterase
VKRFERFVVIGDSTAQGVGDPDASGRWFGFGGRLAQRLDGVAYANLAVSGYVTRQIRDTQLAPALALRPDLVAIVAGMNDLLRPRFDAGAIAEDLAAMHRAFAAVGAIRLTFTMPDVAHRLVIPPFDRVISRRARALNAAIRRTTAEHGGLLIDLATHPSATDPRMWSLDRLHGNATSHARIADGCAEALGLAGSDGAWREALPQLPDEGAVRRIAANLAWSRRYLAPWLWGHARRAIRR